MREDEYKRKNLRVSTFEHVLRYETFYLGDRANEQLVLFSFAFNT